jgi:hypothetical protein
MRKAVADGKQPKATAGGAAVGTTTAAAAAKPDSSPKKKKWGKPKKGKTTKEEVADILDKVIADWVHRSCICLIVSDSTAHHRHQQQV